MAQAGTEKGTEDDPLFLGSAEDAPADTIESIPIENQRESVRGVLAGVLVAILGTTILGSLALFANDRLSGEEIEQVSQIFVTPLVAIVGSVVGFYFGGQVARDARNDVPGKGRRK